MKSIIRNLTIALGVLSLCAAPLRAAEDEIKKDIVDTAAATETFKTLTAALGAGGLAEVLKGEGPFTVFAPTDKAFAKLPEGTVEDLLKPGNKDKLVDLLKSHVVAGKVDSEAFSELEKLTTLNK